LGIMGILSVMPEAEESYQDPDEPLKVGEFETGPVARQELKRKTEEELIGGILGSSEWPEEDYARIMSAYELAKDKHGGDLYKGQPYIYHLLRVAARIVLYMGVYDADVVVAALLHDSVEDHAEDLVEEPDADPVKLQEQALKVIGDKFGVRSAEIVQAVTNEPVRPGPKLTYEEKLARYAEKVDKATETFEGWLVKFSDWCENGLGIVHSELSQDSPEVAHFGRKYFGDVFAVFTRRYKQYESRLSPEGANYVATQLTLGYQRLGLELR
jgi:hypothetical protein